MQLQLDEPITAMWAETVPATVLQRAKSVMRGYDVFDGRNVHDPKRLRADGFEYYGMGRH